MSKIQKLSNINNVSLKVTKLVFWFLYCISNYSRPSKFDETDDITLFYASMIKVSTVVSRSSPGETFISFLNRKGHITNRTFCANVKRTTYIFYGAMPLFLLKILNLHALICSQKFYSNHFQFFNIYQQTNKNLKAMNYLGI